MDPFVAEIRLLPYNFPPVGWAFCNGQIMPISQFTALFSLLGTFYGGDGKSNFALPDLRGRVATFYGQGPGLQSHVIGEASGEETHTLLAAEMPAHSHVFNAETADGAVADPTNNFIAISAGKVYSSSAPIALSDPRVTSSAGGNQPHNNLMPYLTLNYCIALQGVFPPRG
jgi:microcystin-dependent protein